MEIFSSNETLFWSVIPKRIDSNHSRTPFRESFSYLALNHNRYMQSGSKNLQQLPRLAGAEDNYLQRLAEEFAAIVSFLIDFKKETSQFDCVFVKVPI